jgi:hypothetical protein
VIEAVCLCVASGVAESTFGSVTRTIIDGNFDNIVKGAILGFARGLLRGVAYVLVGTAMPVRFGIATLCKCIIIINSTCVVPVLALSWDMCICTAKHLYLKEKLSR